MDSFKNSSRIVLSGSSGMLGGAIQSGIEGQGGQTLQLIRRTPMGEGKLQWDPASDRPVKDASVLEGYGAAIHLSGASVAAHRWTDTYKHEMAQSRIDSTRRLATLLAGLERRPECFLVASAIGIYGDRGDEILDENSELGTGFLAELCRHWEAAAKPAQDAGIRVVHLRFGVVLGRGEGALKQMLPAFRVGLGAKLGSGRQWMSWVALADVVSAVLFALQHTGLVGPVNITSPNAVTNAEFTRALGRQLGRPALFTAPAFALRLMFGQMADEALLASARVNPAKLLGAGFRFSLSQLDAALRAAMNK